MDATTKKVIALLSDERFERRCAAAMVLAELRVKDPEALEGLGRCVQEENRVLQLYALEALAASRSPKITALITPLLDSADEEVSAQALAVLASQGTRAAGPLLKELKGLTSAPLSRRRALVSLLARTHDLAISAQLLALLPDPELGEYVLNALRSEVEQLSPQEVGALRERASLLLKDKTWLADPDGVGRTLRLIGYLRDPKSVRTLLPFTATKQPRQVRLAALAALRRPLAAATTTDKAVTELLAHADDADPTLARAALDTLRGIKLPPEASEPLVKLAESQHADTRRYALEALGRSGDGKVTKNLVSHLLGDDPAARDAAARSLAKLEGAGPLLLKELAHLTDDPERTSLLCRLLRGRAEELKPAARQSIADLALAALEREQPTAPALLDLLAALDAEGYRSALAARAQAHRKAKRYEQAAVLLAKLESKGLIDDEGRYAALVCGLCRLPSKKELGRASRTTDPILHLIVDLLASGTNVAAQLKKEKCLTPDDLFFIGFNFSESKDEDEREFGGALLSHLAQTSPRSKLGRSAKNKLHLTGLE